MWGLAHTTIKKQAPNAVSMVLPAPTSECVYVSGTIKCPCPKGMNNMSNETTTTTTTTKTSADLHAVLRAFAVRGADGTIDTEASLVALAAQAEAFYAEEIELDAKLMGAVCEYLAKAPGRVTVDTLKFAVIQRVWGFDGMTESKHAQVSATVEAWVEANKNKESVDASDAHKTGKLLHSQRGRNGGICLSSRAKELSEKK